MIDRNRNRRSADSWDQAVLGCVGVIASLFGLGAIVLALTFWIVSYFLPK